MIVTNFEVRRLAVLFVQLAMFAGRRRALPLSQS
jgi:hypothetical protein